jgi:hypothetical protein
VVFTPVQSIYLGRVGLTLVGNIAGIRKCILCIFLSMIFLIQLPQAVEAARSQECSMLRLDCTYHVVSIMPDQHIALSDVRLNVFYPNGTFSFGILLSSFKTLDDPYYHGTTYLDYTDPDDLNVGDALSFDRSIYWNGHFTLNNADETKQFYSKTITETDGYLSFNTQFEIDGPIGDNSLYNALIASIIITVVVTVLILIKGRKKS